MKPTIYISGKIANLLIVMALVSCFSTSQIFGQTTKTVGGSGASYSTLKLAFDAINAGTVTGVITLQITGNTTETASAVLNASGSGPANYTSVAIYPAVSGVIITGNMAAPLIDFYGADNVTIDGRVNAVGSARNLTILNTNTSATSNTATLRFINSAENNTIRYCYLKGGAAGIYSGIVLFAGASAGNGNNGNVVDNCSLTSINATDRPYYVIYSYGTAGRTNSSNTISNNSIYDFLRTGAGSYGIYVYLFSTDWTISGNSMYETTSFVPTEGVSYYLVRINNSSGNNFKIVDNYLGGNTELCGGSAWSFASIQPNRFYAIHLDVGTTTTSSVQHNVIRTFSITSASDITFMGIDVNSGNADIGTVTGNIIGSAAGTGSVLLTNSNSSTSAISYGIYVNSAGTVNVSNNTIGSITVQSSSAAIAHSFCGIFKPGNVAGTLTVNNNLIGSTGTANSIQAVTPNTSSAAQNVYGIFSNGSVSTVITNNTVANLSNAHAYQYATNGQVAGIFTTKGVNTIQGNIIRDIYCGSPSNDPNSSAAIIGIAQLSTSANQMLTGNTIYNLNSTYTGTRPVNVFGIYYYGGTSGANSISGNFIQSFSLASTASASSPASLTGIRIFAGSSTITNNIVNLGVGVTVGYRIYGIYENGNAGNNNNVWFNSIYIGGTTSGGNASSYALYNVTNNNARDFRNNVLFNARSGGTTGKHYAIRLAGNNSVTIDYNDYHVSGTGGMMGNFGIQDKTDLASWKIATTQDEHSLNIDPGYAVPGGTTPVCYHTSASLPGVSGTGVQTDYSGLTRSAVPRMGALESNNFIWKGGTSDVFGVESNWAGGIVPPDGSDISFDPDPTNHCVLDQNRSLKNITNTQADDDLITNGHQLTITGNLIFTGGAQVDATSASSVIAFGGSSTQSIPSGAFVSNTTDALTLNNSNGLTLEGDLTVLQTLTLTNGALTIGANTLSLNGAIAATSGTITGGSSSNLVVGGAGASTNLPSITLNNLTLNRTNGISLSGPVNAAGTLTLTAGTLTLGANSLTISGSSPTSTTGNLDAGGASANLIFANTAAIILPASFFAGAINNLTITGTGGITAGSDITVNGVLTLSANNPSTTKGLLEMTRNYGSYPGTSNSVYLDSWMLNMGATATTMGAGDVTGTIKRATILENTPYTFGHQYTTVMLTTGLMPTALSVTVTIGNTPPGDDGSDLVMRDCYQRTYEIVPTISEGYVSTAHLAANFHYLDTELTSSLSPFHVNHEATTVTWDYDVGGGLVADEHGRANYDFTNNYIGLANVPIDYFINIPGHAWRTIFSLRDYYESHKTWNGSVNTDWYEEGNWTTGLPGVASHIIIPDVATTSNRSPVLPSAVTINTMTIENGGILIMGNNILTIQTSLSGGWEDQNPVGNDPGTSTLIFSRTGATISGNARFHNVEIADGADVTNQTGSTVKIENSLVRNGTGKWYADVYNNTVEYNKPGDQIVLLPDGTTAYRSLIISGSGTKTMPASSFAIHGNFTLVGTSSTTAGGNLTIDGTLSTGVGAEFISGNFSHTILGDVTNDGAFMASSGSTLACKGQFTNNGSFTGTGSMMVMNGNSEQTIGGSVQTSFDNLTLNNAAGLQLAKSESVDGLLALTSGKIRLGDNNLLMGATASITGSNSAKYVITDGLGSLSQRVFNNATNVSYPVGLGSVYLPVIVNLTAESTPDNISARVADGLYTSYNGSDVPTGTFITDKVVKNTWHLNEGNSGGSDATITVQWNTGSEGTAFDRSKCHVAHYTGGAWVHTSCAAASGADPYTQSLSNVTSFSPFGTFGQTIGCSLAVSEFCAGSSVSIDYSVSGGALNSGNVFTAQLSDATGGFTYPVAIGSVTGTNSGSIYAAIPVITSYGNGYRIRVVSSNPAIEGDNNGVDLTINQPSFIGVAPTVADLHATGTDVKWYHDATGGSPLATTAVLENGHHYFASQTVNGCESASRFDITATVDPTPCKPTGEAIQINSSGATIANLTVTSGDNIRWYHDSTGGTPLDLSVVLENNHHYYATQTINCTESATRLDITVSIP